MGKKLTAAATCLAVCLTACATTTPDQIIISKPIQTEAKFSFEKELVRSANAVVAFMQLLHVQDKGLSESQKKAATVARISAMMSLGLWIMRHMSEEEVAFVQDNVKRMLEVAQKTEDAQNGTVTTSTTSIP